MNKFLKIAKPKIVTSYYNAKKNSFKEKERKSTGGRRNDIGVKKIGENIAESGDQGVVVLAAARWRR